MPMIPAEQQLIDRVAGEVRKRLEGAESGHDWWHIVRVWNMAKRLGQEEGAEMVIVELGALLHDIADWKFHAGDDTAGPRIAREILEAAQASPNVVDRVVRIVETVSFKGAGVANAIDSLEGQVVQDADCLDAIGAIGVARTFAYGGHKNRVMYDPNEKPVLHASKEAYMKSTGTTINHFYEKLLLLKDRMHTKAAREIAADRHAFLEEYLSRFLAEWEGKR